jgi:hypothetical protein
VLRRGTGRRLSGATRIKRRVACLRVRFRANGSGSFIATQGRLVARGTFAVAGVRGGTTRAGGSLTLATRKSARTGRACRKLARRANVRQSGP